MAATFLETGLSAGISNSQGVFLKPLLGEFGWTRGMVAGAFALGNLVAAGLATFLGVMADKYGPRIMVAVGGIFTGGAYLLASAVSALWQFYVAFGLVMGLGRSAGWGSIGPTISRWFVSKRGLAQGIVQAGAGLGTIAFPPLATYLIFTHNWRFAYAVLGIVLVVAVGGAALALRRSPGDMGLEPDGKRGDGPRGEPGGVAPARASAAGHVDLTPPESGLSLRQALATRSFRLLALCMMASSFTQQLILVHLVPHATDVGFSPAVAATFMSVLGVANIVGKVAMGIVSDRIGRRNSLIISFGLAAGMLYWLMVARSLPAFYLFAAIYGFAYGSWIPMFPAIAGDLFGLGALGAIFGTLAAANSVGGALGAFLGGYLFDVTESYNYAFVTASVLLIAGVAGLTGLRLPGRPQKAATDNP
ncbi:MAG: MFS transporter [Chloroflexi bacterium]|nr:MFS transporter [Chloroflexota bacterium]